ncbi:MAG TPA: guanylate kinase [Acetobacteraceae bacterium]|nr:guanylate kinase [Acetobacteraceae bacterium]
MSTQPIRRRGLCLVLVAPSGAGKTSITRALLATDPGLTLSISVTTRAPRPTEREGVDYFFRTEAEFDALARSGGLLEWARVFNRGYGTPRAPVEQALAAGQDVVFDIDWQGHRQLRAALPDDVVGVFILPPSLAALEARLQARAADSDAEIARRMQAARSEMSHWAEFGHVIVNHAFERAVEDVRAVLRAGRLGTARQIGLRDFLATGLVGGETGGPGSASD